MAELSSSAILAKINSELKKIKLEDGINSIKIMLPDQTTEMALINNKTATIDLSSLYTGEGPGGEVNIIEGISVKLPGQLAEQRADIADKIATIDLSKINANQVYYVSGHTDENGNWIGELEGITTYWDGMVIFYRTPADNRANETLNINDMGAITIVQYAANLEADAYPKDSIIPLMYRSKLNKLREGAVWDVLEDNMETAAAVSAIDTEWLDSELI